MYISVYNYTGAGQAVRKPNDIRRKERGGS